MGWRKAPQGSSHLPVKGRPPKTRLQLTCFSSLCTGEFEGREVNAAPSSLTRLYPGRPPEAPASASTPSALGLLHRKLQAKQGPPPPPPLSATQLLQEPCGGGCRPPSTPGQGITARWEPSRGLCCRSSPQGLAQEHPLERAGDRGLCLSSVPLPLPQQPKDFASSSGEFALARWGFLPSGVLLMSAKLSQDRAPQPGQHLPPNICILTLAMMIAGIPTVPVPGVREEDMVHAAQCFMAGNLELEGMQGEAAQRRRWAATQRLGPSGKRDRQRKRPTGRSLLPLFLAQLEK
ncbi:spermatogenesis-associated protein 25 [Elgaria multicarinata webbii]|uniref:spermatogenesis-associated protein 25 n=1 Tax=Elgaria multicarinata webbii TaxID=159646 RepID=UPI002FCD07E1